MSVMCLNALADFFHLFLIDFYFRQVKKETQNTLVCKMQSMQKG